MSEAKEALIEYLKEIAYDVGLAEGMGEDEYIAMKADQAQEDIYDYIGYEHEKNKKLIKALLEVRMVPPISTDEIVKSYTEGYEEGQEEGYYEEKAPPGIFRRIIRRSRRRIIR